MKKQTSFTTLKAGFTLVELMVSVGIFALMTTFLLAKYGTFNQSVLLTNLAYDVALTIRNAQSYGLNVRSVGDVENFDTAYGVHFSDSANTLFTFFADPIKDGIYTSDKKISDYLIKRGSVISDLCVGNDSSSCSSTGVDTVDVSFIRPNPDGIIKINGATSPSYKYAEITLRATDGSLKKVVVRSTGQIAITN